MTAARRGLGKRRVEQSWATRRSPGFRPSDDEQVEADTLDWLGE